VLVVIGDLEDDELGFDGFAVSELVECRNAFICDGDTDIE
jgi:hypothetical protein